MVPVPFKRFAALLTGFAGLAATALALIAGPAAASDFPARPITIIVTFPPGGGTDLLARLLGPELQKIWGQNVVIDNRPGASGNIGAQTVARSPADGYTLLMVNSSYAVNPGVFSKLPFDPKGDFAPVVNVAFVPSVVVVPAGSPFKTLGDLLAAARPGSSTVSFGSCGNGTPQHLAGEMINQQAKAAIQHVPYKGCGPALTDVVGSQLPAAVVTASSAMQHITAGKLRALAVTSKERSRFLPDVPTVAEQGLPGYELDQWHGLLAPAATPPAVVDSINADVARSVRSPAIHEKLLLLLYTPTESTPAAFRQLVV
ncbi:MAG: tripartite tricarboxylate transporter substrate binding protein, partial [Lautropia sp.]